MASWDLVTQHVPVRPFPFLAADHEGKMALLISIS